jgi:hypothetical protein
MEKQRRSGAWERYWPLLAVAVGGLLLGCVFVFPRLLYPPLTAMELQAHGIHDSKEQIQLQNDRLKLQNDARTTLAKAVAGDKDVGVGAASIVQQCIRAGLLDEIHIDLVPVLLGGGVRLFDHLGTGPIDLERTRVIEGTGVTHLTFRVVK